MTQQGKTRSQFESEIVARAWQDAAYKEQLMKDPKSALQEAVTRIGGKKLPDDLKVTVLEETPKNVYIVLPPNPQSTGGAKLTDNQLEAAAGGAYLVSSIGAVY